MASVTSSVAFSQILITELYLSSLVIKPRLYCFNTLFTCSSASAKICFFAAGTLTSSIDTVIPAVVECLKPVALM